MQQLDKRIEKQIKQIKKQVEDLIDKEYVSIHDFATQNLINKDTARRFIVNKDLNHISFATVLKMMIALGYELKPVKKSKSKNNDKQK